MSVACLDTPPKEPVIVTEVEAVTVLVVTVNVALVAPAATVTLAGVLADALLSESVTTVADGAAPVNVTVPCDELPPTTLVGFRVNVERVTLAGWG